MNKSTNFRQDDKSTGATISVLKDELSAMEKKVNLLKASENDLIEEKEKIRR